jgi:hypothetical protein
MTAAHRNLCEYAEDERSLYKVWDDDLTLQMRRRQRCELMAYFCFAGSLVAWGTGKSNLAFGAAIIGGIFLYFAIKYMVDESNVNYLMHRWDLDRALNEFRLARQREGAR